METFYSRLNNVVKDAIVFITKLIEEGTSKSFISEEEIKEFSDEIYDLPNVYIYGKYGSYDEFAVIGVFKKDGEINLNLFGKSEGVSHKRLSIKLDGGELSSVETCCLADLLAEKMAE